MIDRATRFAQLFAGGLSRRNFLGRVGQAAGIAAATCASVLLIPNSAQAKRVHGGGGNACQVDGDCKKGFICLNGKCSKPRKKH
jgi:hypothetical protein